MIYLLPLSIFVVIGFSMWIAERNNWEFGKRLAFTALISLPYTVIVFILMAYILGPIPESASIR